jgi:hypothetical protein
MVHLVAMIYSPRLESIPSRPAYWTFVGGPRAAGVTGLWSGGLVRLAPGLRPCRDRDAEQADRSGAAASMRKTVKVHRARIMGDDAVRATSPLSWGGWRNCRPWRRCAKCMGVLGDARGSCPRNLNTVTARSRGFQTATFYLTLSVLTSAGSKRGASTTICADHTARLAT